MIVFNYNNNIPCITGSDDNYEDYSFEDNFQAFNYTAHGKLSRIYSGGVVVLKPSNLI